MAKAVLFDLDDTLYDNSLQVKLARENAVKTMVAAGLDASEEDAMKALAKIVAQNGPNYQHHYDDLAKTFNKEPNPRIVASGIVAYHETKRTYLVPYPDTIPTLLFLRESGYKTGVITDGVPLKQWEKLIRLGLMDFFHTVIVSGGADRKPSEKPFLKAASELGAAAGECVFVGDRLDRDIAGAKKAGMISVQLSTGRHAGEKPAEGDEEPDYIISHLSDLHRIMPAL